MKKVICLALCFVIMAAVCPAFAAIHYTLPEKIEKQISIGSGLKGSFTLHGEGNEPLITALAFLQDAEIQLRFLRSGDDFHCYLYQEKHEDEKKGMTELNKKGDSIFFRSDLIPNEVFLLPGLEKIADSIRRPEGGNPPFISAVIRCLQMESDERASLLNPVIDFLSPEIEIWLAQYAEASSTYTLNNGTSAVDLSYHIPMSDFKAEIVLLLNSVLQTEEGRLFIDRILNDEQKSVYANPKLDYFYTSALDSLENGFDIQYTRTVTTLGQPVSSHLELPFDESRTGYSSLEIDESNGLIAYTLRNDDGLFSFQTSKDIDLLKLDGFSAWLYMRKNSDQRKTETAHALRIDIHHSSELSADEENRDHQTDHWKISAERDLSRLPEGENAADYPEELPFNLDVVMHFYSRSSQSSPTTLDIQALLESQNSSLSLSASVKTASPWEFAPFETNGAVSWLSLSDDTRKGICEEWYAAAKEQLVSESSSNTTDFTKTDTNTDGVSSPVYVNKKMDDMADPASDDKNALPEKDEPAEMSGSSDIKEADQTDSISSESP